jgi:aryl-alcohol dehydrogenase-like predicted oxidoreductase
MRLSTLSARDESRAIATLHAAFDAGVTIVDTADAYALDEADVGHNERLIARALTSWPGERNRISVATKGGLRRPEGKWAPDGRARHLRAACEASRVALGVERIALYQLHAPDPRVAWTTSVRALERLLRSQAVEAIGLCNVTVTQLEAARAIVPVASVQVELSPWKDRSVDSGVVDYCLTHGIRLFAYRPFGGEQGCERLRRDGLLQEMANQRGVTPFAIVLAWMRGLAPHIVPLPGTTRPETARDSVRAQQMTLTDGEQAELDRHFPIGRIRTRARQPARHAASPRGDADSSAGGSSDIVMVMGLPGAGKSTLASELVARGYHRLNRDEAGGSLAGLLPRLRALIDDGVERIVLDNTYLSRASRAPVIQLAAARGRSVRGVWLAATVEDAQVNLVERMLGAHQRLLSSDELRAGGGPDRLSPTALFRAQRELEVPDASEGFQQIEVKPFVRRFDPARRNRAVIVWCDGVIRPRRANAREGDSDFDERALPSRRAMLARYAAEGFRLFGLSWEPQISEQGVPIADVESEFSQLRARLEIDIDFRYCPHGGGPPVCWCRKPLPGLGVWLAHHYQLDARQCLYVGTSPQDPPFARRLGFQYRHADDFFA